MAGLGVTSPRRPLIGASSGVVRLSGGIGGALPPPNATPAAAPGGPGAAAPPLPNTAQVNPAMQAALDRINAAHAAAAGSGPDPLLQEQVDELRRRRSADTTGRAIARSDAAIRDRAAGQKVGLRRALGRMGAPDSSALKLEMGIDEAAKRQAAGSAADIQLGRERDLDQLAISGQSIMSAPAQYRMQQQQLAANLLGMGASTAANIANQGLADRSLGLQQWQAQNNANLNAAQYASSREDARLGQLLALLRLDPSLAA